MDILSPGVLGTTIGMMGHGRVRAGSYYHVDATNGNDSNDGLVHGRAWQTIAKVNAASFNAGDRILFKRGEAWREMLTLPSSGAAGAPITFGAYGSGVDPIINGADLVTGWVVDAGNVYSVAHAATIRTVVIEDATRLTMVADRGSVVQGSFFLDNPADTLYVWSTDDADPDTHTMEVGIRNGLISSNGQDYITIQNIDMRYSADTAINLNGALNWNIKSCTFESCRAVTIFSGSNASNSLTIEGCTFISGGEEIIYLSSDMHVSGTVLIENNTFSGQNGWAIYEGDCIDIKTGNTATIAIRGNTLTQEAAWVPDGDRSSGDILVSSPATIENNSITNPTDRAIACAPGSDGSIVRYNYIYYDRSGASALMDGITVGAPNCQVYYNILIADDAESTGHNFGIYIVDGDNGNGVEIYNNVVYGSWQTGLIQGTTATFENGLVQNNVFDGFEVFGVYIRTPTGLEVDYNHYWSPDRTGGYGREDGVNYWSWASWQGNGREANGSIGDPLFTDPTDDLTLQSGSPCRDAGTDVSLLLDYAGVSVPQETNPAIGAYEYVA